MGWYDEEGNYHEGDEEGGDDQDGGLGTWTPPGIGPEMPPDLQARRQMETAYQDYLRLEQQYQQALTAGADYEGDPADLMRERDKQRSYYLRLKNDYAQLQDKLSKTDTSEWDIRSSGNTILRVHKRTGKVETLYTAPPSPTSQKPTGLPNSPYLVQPDGTVVPNKYYQPPSASQKPTSLPNSPYLVQPDGTVVPNKYYQPATSTRTITALPNTRYLVDTTGAIIPNEYYEEETDVERRKREYKEEQDRWQRAQQKLSAQMGLTRDMQQSQIQTLPYLAAPGQQYITGGEPGGLFSRMEQAAGRSYNPDNYRAAIINYDPAALWESAQRYLWEEFERQQQAEEEQGGTT